MSEDESTTVRVRKQTRRELRDLKPFDSVSYDDLIQDMLETYKEEQSTNESSAGRFSA